MLYRSCCFKIQFLPSAQPIISVPTHLASDFPISLSHIIDTNAFLHDEGRWSFFGGGRLEGEGEGEEASGNGVRFMCVWREGRGGMGLGPDDASRQL